MKRIISLLIACSWIVFLATGTIAQEERIGRIDWVSGYIYGHGIGFAELGMNEGLARVTSIRAAKVEALRNLLIMIKQMEIGHKNPIEDFVSKDRDRVIRLEGLVKGAELVDSRTEKTKDSLLSVVEMRVCMSAFTQGCASEESLVRTLALDDTKGGLQAPEHAGWRAGPDSRGEPKRVTYPHDSTRPATGVVFSLQGIPYKRVMLPVVAAKQRADLSTVYSVRSVRPEIVRSYGIVRFADTFDQINTIDNTGDNYMIVPVEAVTHNNVLIISSASAQAIHETTRHGNNLLENARVAISAE